MKKLGILLLALLFITTFGFSPTKYLGTFLDSAQDVNADTVYAKSSWSSTEVIRVNELGSQPYALVVVTFTRSAGSDTLTVDFDFQASYDGGTTWTTAYFVRIDPKTNETADSNVVRYPELINPHGVTHLRLHRIDNNDDSNNLTACNAMISIFIE